MESTIKKHKEYQIFSNYGDGYEEVFAEFTKEEALQRLKEYRENEPQYPHKLVVKWCKN